MLNTEVVAIEITEKMPSLVTFEFFYQLKNCIKVKIQHFGNSLIYCLNMFIDIQIWTLPASN